MEVSEPSASSIPWTLQHLYVDFSLQYLILQSWERLTEFTFIIRLVTIWCVWMLSSVVFIEFQQYLCYLGQDFGCDSV